MMINESEGKTLGITSPMEKSGLKERWIGLSEDELNGIEAESIFEAQKKYLHSHVPHPLEWFSIRTDKGSRKSVAKERWSFPLTSSSF